MLKYIEILKPYLQILSIILSISYTLYKYRKDKQKEKAEREKQLAKQHENGVPLPPRSKRRSR